MYFDSNNSELPVRQCGRAIRFYRWGARSAQYFSADSLGAYAAKFPETCCAALAEIRAGKWTAFAPRAIRILASRIIQVRERGQSAIEPHSDPSEVSTYESS